MSKRRLGVVIIFNEETTLEEAQTYLEFLVNECVIDEPPTIHEFNPEHGGPVWYVP